MKLGKYAYEKPQEIQIQVDEFDGGTNLLQEPTRLQPNEASESTNLMLVGDGLWHPRWGTATYGGEISGATTIDGFTEYKNDAAGTRDLIAVAAGKIWKKNGNSWTELTGATLTAGYAVDFLQIGGYLYMANGTDSLVRLSNTTLSTYTEIDAPVGLGLNIGSGLTTGVYNHYYQVTGLNDIGETVGSTEATITTNKERSVWSNAATERITATWTTLVGASRYQVYYSDESGYEVLLGSSETTTYVDDGTAVPNPYIEVPDANTTGGPKFSTLCLSGNRMWGTKDPDNLYRVYFTGTGTAMGVFSDFYGGGWIDLEKGGRTEPQKVVDYRDGQGNSKATVICATPEGTGGIWHVSLGAVTVEDVSFTIPTAFKVVGSTGTNAPRSAVIAQNDVYFLNKRGVNVLGNEKQFWGILRTNELSVKIRPFIESAIGSKLDEACSYYYDDKVFFSLSTNGLSNNRTFLYDREHRAWVCSWDIGFTQFGEYTDSSGVTHFLGGSTTDGYLVEISSGIYGDRGQAFTTRYRGPQFPVAKDWSKFGKVKKARIKLGEPKGSVMLTVSGTGQRQGYSNVATATITVVSSASGMGFDLLGEVLLGDTEGSVETFAQANTQRHLKVGKRLRDVQITVETTVLENHYTLLGYQIQATRLDLNDPSSEKL